MQGCAKKAHLSRCRKKLCSACRESFIASGRVRSPRETCLCKALSAKTNEDWIWTAILNASGSQALSSGLW